MNCCHELEDESNELHGVTRQREQDRRQDQEPVPASAPRLERAVSADPALLEKPHKREINSRVCGNPNASNGLPCRIGTLPGSDYVADLRPGCSPSPCPNHSDVPDGHKGRKLLSATFGRRGCKDDASSVAHAAMASAPDTSCSLCTLRSEILQREVAGTQAAPTVSSDSSANLENEVRVLLCWGVQRLEHCTMLFVLDRCLVPFIVFWIALRGLSCVLVPRSSFEMRDSLECRRI